METQSGARSPVPPTAEEARAALQETERARETLHAVTSPWWFTLGIAAYMATVSLALALPAAWTAVTCALLLGGLVVLFQAAKKRVGYTERVRGGSLVALVAGAAVCVAVIGAGTFLDDSHGAPVWFLVAAVNVAVVLSIDLGYRWRARKAA